MKNAHHHHRPAPRYNRHLRALTALLVLAGAIHKAGAETPLIPKALGILAPNSKDEGPIQPMAALLTPESRWHTSMEAFAKADQEKHPANDGVLFVGSSTIRLWSNLSQDFRQVPVIINRGFGGSTMADCNHFVRELVIQYKPKQIMVYAGDNDLAEGRSPSDVRDSFAAFVRSVRAELPHTRIAYISIKPSPLRAELMPKIRQTNTLLADYVQTLPNAQFIDIFQAMLSPDGQPRPELFLPDRLHMNEAGYKIWQSVIAGQLPGSAPLGTPLPSAQMAGIQQTQQ